MEHCIMSKRLAISFDDQSFVCLTMPTQEQIACCFGLVRRKSRVNHIWPSTTLKDGDTFDPLYRITICSLIRKIKDTFFPLLGIRKRIKHTFHNVLTFYFASITSGVISTHELTLRPTEAILTECDLFVLGDDLWVLFFRASQLFTPSLIRRT